MNTTTPTKGVRGYYITNKEEIQMKYSVISRRKGNRRAYSDGFIYPDLDCAKQWAESKYMSGQYTMVKVVEYDSNKMVAQYTKSKQ